MQTIVCGHVKHVRFKMLFKTTWVPPLTSSSSNTHNISHNDTCIPLSNSSHSHSQISSSTSQYPSSSSLLFFTFFTFGMDIKWRGFFTFHLSTININASIDLIQTSFNNNSQSNLGKMFSQVDVATSNWATWYATNSTCDAPPSSLMGSPQVQRWRHRKEKHTPWLAALRG